MKHEVSQNVGLESSSELFFMLVLHFSLSATSWLKAICFFDIEFDSVKNTKEYWQHIKQKLSLKYSKIVSSTALSTVGAIINTNRKFLRGALIPLMPS